MRAVLPPPPRLRLAAAIVGAWSAVALALSLQGYLASADGGRAQPWWPSLGYSFAVFSVWAALTWPVLAGVRRVEASGARLPARLALYAAGLFAVSALHVALFVAVYWPLYNDGGALGRLEMGQRMFVRNLGTNVIFYAALVGLGLRLARRPAPAAAPPAEALRARSRGAVRIVPLSDVDWIGAAGNYAEAHTAQGAVLLDESLASLAARLPAGFARIHRGAIVRLDRVAEIRSLGRGDAEVILRCGAALRLSRRYRPALSAWLSGAPRGA